MTDNDTGFAPGKRVYHRQRRQFGTYVEAAWTSGESFVEFPDEANECYRVTTAQLVPADEVEENC